MARVRTQSPKKNPESGIKAKRKQVRNQRVCGRRWAYFGTDFSAMMPRWALKMILLSAYFPTAAYYGMTRDKTRGRSFPQNSSKRKLSGYSATESNESLVQHAVGFASASRVRLPPTSDTKISSHRSFFTHSHLLSLLPLPHRYPKDNIALNRCSSSMDEQAKQQRSDIQSHCPNPK